MMDSTIGPLNDLISMAFALVVENLPRDLTWPILLLTIGLATSIWLLRSGFGAKGADGRMRRMPLREFLLPAEIYTHISARVDISLYIFERLLRPLWLTTVVVSVAPSTESLVIEQLNTIFGSGPALMVHYGWMLLYSLVTLLCYDFIFFLIHYAEHKLPLLWAIHKVHHSAEVLTPLTRYREHFLEGPIYAFGAAAAFGIAGGVFGWLFTESITEATLFNIGFFSMLFGFNGAFRHYHIAFHYPGWLSRWLQSPVMHHTHHSYLEQHWDTNFAAVTSIWDRMFGTLYIPEKDEHTPWGLGPSIQENYRSFWQNVSGPFRDWAVMIRNKTKSRRAGFQK